MNVNVEKVKTQNKVQFKKHFTVGIILAIVVIGVILINVVTSFTLRQTVDVLVLKNALTQDSVLTEENMTKRTMLKAEYEKEGIKEMSDGSKKRQIILWEDRKRVIGAYASYYIRQNTPIYWDSLTKESTKKNSYLYKMDGELIKLDVDPTVFGDMLVPGDRVNIRCTYTENSYKLPTVEEFNLMQSLGLSMNTQTTKSIMLFNGVSVLDMLNADGESIFDKYYKFLVLPKTQQATTLNSEAFKEAVKPTKILLCVTSEEADMYNQIQNNNPKYMLSLLSRQGSNLILEALSDLNTSKGVSSSSGTSSTESGGK